MNNNLSKKIEQLEQNYSETTFEKENYKAIAKLFYYGMKHQWVKEKIEQADLTLNFNDSVTKEQIDDYISHIKSIERRKKIRSIIEKLDDDFDKAFLLNELIQNK